MTDTVVVVVAATLKHSSRCVPTPVQTQPQHHPSPAYRATHSLKVWIHLSLPWCGSGEKTSSRGFFFFLLLFNPIHRPAHANTGGTGQKLCRTEAWVEIRIGAIPSSQCTGTTAMRKRRRGLAVMGRGGMRAAVVVSLWSDQHAMYKVFIF